MFMGGDNNLNFSQVHTDSVKEILRQTMLDQEDIFRGQVHELHRIYITQKILMKDRHLIELNSPQVGNAASGQLTCWSFTDQPRLEPRSSEKTQSTIFLDGLTQSVQDSSTQEGRDPFYRPYQRPKLPPSLSSNRMNNIDSNISDTGYNLGCIGKFTEGQKCFPDKNSYCPDEVKLSLSINGSSTKKFDGGKHLTDRNSRASFRDSIDLEEPEGYDKDHVFLRYGQVTSGPWKDSQIPFISNHKLTDVMVKDPADSFLIPHSCIGSNNVSQGRNHIKRGLDDAQGDNVYSSNVVKDLDLNKIHLDESSTESSNSLLGYNSAASSAGDAILGLREPNRSNGTNAEIIFKSKAKDDSGTCITDLKSMSKLQPRHQPGNTSRNMDIQTNFYSGIKLGKAQFEENGGKIHEDINHVRLWRSQSATGESHYSRLSSSSKFDCTVNDNKIATRTMHSGTNMESGLLSTCLIQNAESSQVTETACQLNWSSSGISEMKLQVCDKKKGKSTDIDALIQDAATSLISISLESPVNIYTSSTKPPSKIQNNTVELPEYSSDSYESMVMKLSETSTDDYCVTSNAVELNDMINKDSRIKLRRGRRLKDFQKDILPGMSSLARHEIQEDINIMEGVLRSREYKRLQSKTASVGNWFTPVRSRRSRLNYVGRRNCQW